MVVCFEVYGVDGCIDFGVVGDFGDYFGQVVVFGQIDWFEVDFVGMFQLFFVEIVDYYYCCVQDVG